MSNLCDITCKTVWPRSSSSINFKHMYVESFFVWLHFKVQNIFFFLDNYSALELMVKNM